MDMLRRLISCRIIIIIIINHGLQKRRYRGPGEHSPPGVVLGGGEHRLDRCGARGLTEHRPLK